jgi:ankyrin repeat protein
METLIYILIFLTTAAALLYTWTHRKRWQLLRIIKSDDAIQVEAARDLVTPRAIPYLINKYWHEKDWARKRAIVELLQDQTHPDLPKMMLDFLRAPLAPGDEQTQLAQAIALGFIDERYDRFTAYYNDRDLLARDVRSVLGAHGLKAEPAQKSLPSPPQPRPAENTSKSVPANQRLANGIVSDDQFVVEQALRDGADPNIRVRSGNYKGCSGLMLAILLGRYQIAQRLIEARADIHYTRPDLQGKYHHGRGQTALWWAANKGHLPLAEALIQRGADVDTPDHFGGTPLTTAASCGQLEMVRYLVGQGADIHASLTTIGHASEQPDGRKAFHLAAGNGHLSVVEYLLEAGNHPDECGGSGYTPLMLAVQNNLYDLADFLIQHGADVNAKHTGPGGYIALRGWTPLVFAISGGFVRMTKLLIHSGADIHYRVPASERWDGKKLPERGMLDFTKGKRGEQIRALLNEKGLS